jgi:WD40-like Beta Propeller Repeat
MATILTFVLIAVFAAQSAVPNLSGRWKLDRDASTGTPPVNDVVQLVINQSSDDVNFSYEGRDNSVLAAETFETDWIKEKRFATRTQIGYARARWDRNSLLVETTVVLNVEGTQSFSYEERWSLSPDGRTLTQTSSDGKKLVFERVPEPVPKKQ